MGLFLVVMLVVVLVVARRLGRRTTRRTQSARLQRWGQLGRQPAYGDQQVAHQVAQRPATPPTAPPRQGSPSWPMTDVALRPGSVSPPVALGGDLVDSAALNPIAVQAVDASAESMRGAPTQRDIGSAALESTLDSTIESSLFGVTAGDVTMSTLPGGAPLRLPAEVTTEVIALLNDGQEVAAVRIVCDAMGCGILDATRTVRSLR